MGVFGDGYTSPRGANVKLKFALIDQSGQLLPYALGTRALTGSTPMLTWRELPEKGFEAWAQQQREDSNLPRICQASSSGTCEATFGAGHQRERSSR